jgi:hypothetical protein
VTSTRDDSPQFTDIDLRRKLLAGGAAALAVSMVSGRHASAAGLSSSELDLLKFAQGLELALHDLYDQALEVDKNSAAWTVMADSHESFAQAIAGLAGLSANQRNDDLFNTYREAIRGADRIKTAYDLESAAAATHIDLIGKLSDAGAAEVVASIAAAESRHCVVLADVLGNGNDLGMTLTNSAQPIEA